MKMEIIEGLVFEKNISNILVRTEFNRIYTLEISEVYYMFDLIVKNNKDFIIENEDRIRLFQHFIKIAPRNLYDMYSEAIQSHISNASNKEESAKEFNSIIMPIIIIALKNNYEENLKINKIKEKSKSNRIKL